MATTKFYLDLRGRAKDGKGSILITIAHNRTTATIPTGIRVSIDEWNGKQVIKCPDSGALNSKLFEQKSKIDRAIAILSLDDSFNYMTATQIKAEVSKKKSGKISGHLVSEMFDEYMKIEMANGTREIYRTTLNKITAFSGDNIKMENITLRWLHSFDQYLSKTLCANARSIYMRSLRAVCNYARNIGVMAVYPFQNFQIKSEPTKKRCVSAIQLKRFLEYETSDKNSKFRDYFMLMFYLIGINAVDLLLAKNENVVDGRLEYIRAKTHKKYSIKIEPEADVLLKRYSGKEWLLEAMDHYKNHKNFIHDMNDALKEIGEVYTETVPDPEDLFGEPREEKVIKSIIPGISTYYARHTWATLAYEIGIPIDIISQALGHSFGNKTTLVYIKVDQAKVDEANRKVIDYFSTVSTSIFTNASLNNSNSLSSSR